MNIKLLPVLMLIGLIALTSCNTSSKIVEAPIIEESLLDTLYITDTPIDKQEDNYQLPVYQASATRHHDLLHTRLKISFDWTQQHVIGEAELLLKPYFYASDVLELDAKNFVIHSIDIGGNELQYSYDNAVLKVLLDKLYTRNDTFLINIKYTGRPNEGPSGGSRAITSDKGLFFINPLNDHANKPQQIWTQGETENNSRWFPTIDRPNERCSQEIFVTVEDRFKTLSNGVLVSSTANEDGTRTDYWKQEKPHAPYLFMLGVGEYSVVNDKWKDIPIYYFVEPAFEAHAQKIFDHTPEMINFFSDKLNYPFPWDKYAQIVCRDYVSGAMENTGAVVFGEFVQKTSRELLDGNNDDIVAHELFHHWFGDLVTCESWSNLTLNEGFATYSEYLWKEYKEGHSAAEMKRIQDFNDYLMASAQSGPHDLIDFEYNNREDMFDAHSYNKGGLIVHMLRSYVGDDAFFNALNLYLTKNAYSDVEAHELRLAFEDTVGEDLNWFFNQWFYDQGHPILDINYDIDSQNMMVSIEVKQIQDPEQCPPVYILPVKTALYFPSGKKTYIDLVLDQRNQLFEIPIEDDEIPDVVVFDGQNDLLAIIKENRSDSDYFNLFRLSDEYADKYHALKALKGNKDFSSVFGIALKDKAPEIRYMAISNIYHKNYTDELKRICLDDAFSYNRSKALNKIKDIELAEKLINSDQSYRVINTALDIIVRKNPSKALKYIDKLRQDYHVPLLSNMAKIYSISGDASYLSFFEENLEKVDQYNFFSFISNYEKLAQKAPLDDMVKTAIVLQGMAMDNSSNYFKKYACTNIINNLHNHLISENHQKNLPQYKNTILELEEILKEIIRTTDDMRLKSSFNKFNTP